MEASGAGQTADQGADETPVGDAPAAEPTASEVPSPSGNGIVVVCGIFEPGSVVELVERGPRDVRPGGSSAVRGRRTVDGEGEVGFAGLIPGDLFFVTGYVDGEFRPIRCVAQDPSSSMTLLQPPEQALPGQQGTAQTPVVEEPPAEPATATEGEGLPEGVTSPVLGTGDAQPQRYYLHNIEEEPDAAIWRKANVREQVVPADESRTPNDLWVYAGSEEPVELGSDWTLYEGPTEPVPPTDEAAPDTAAPEAPAASSTPEAGPAQTTPDGTAVDSTTTAPAGEQGADTEAGGSPATTETASETSQAVDPAASDAAPQAEPSETAQAKTEVSGPGLAAGTDAQAQAANEAKVAAAPDAASVEALAAPVDDPNPPAPDAGTPDASESSGTGQANGGAVEETKASAAVAEDAGATVGDQAAGEAAAQVVADPQAAADANSPTAQTPSSETDWDKLVKQAEGLGVPNAASLSDAELRQSISEKSATPVV